MNDFESRVLNGAGRMIQRHMIKISQAGAGTNLKRRVNVTRNYLEDLHKLRNYLYGGRSTVRNIQGFGRNRLNEDIRMAEQMYAADLYDYLHDKRINVIHTARNIFQEHMANAPEYNRNSTLTAKKIHFQRRARGYRRVKQYIETQIRNEPMLAENASIKRLLEKTESDIRKMNILNRRVNTAHERIQTMRRKYPGAGPY